MDSCNVELSSDETKICQILIIKPTNNLIRDIINYRRYKNFPASQFIVNCLRNFRFIYFSCYKNGYRLSSFGMSLDCNHKRLLIEHIYSVEVVTYMLDYMRIPIIVIDLLEQFLKIADNKNVSIYTKQSSKRLVKLTPVKVKIHYDRFEYICSNVMTDKKLEELFKGHKNKKYVCGTILKECEFPDEKEMSKLTYRKRVSIFTNY